MNHKDINTNQRNNVNKISVKNLNIIAINVNSIISNVRKYNLQESIDKLEPDIVLVSETKLTPRHRLSFENYDVIKMTELITGGRGYCYYYKRGNKVF